jgi:hypothetical protein
MVIKPWSMAMAVAQCQASRDEPAFDWWQKAVINTAL